MEKISLDANTVRLIIGGSLECIARSKQPSAKKGNRLFVKEPLWISECGEYYARKTYQTRGMGYDVLSIDGKNLWHGGDKTPQLEYPDHRFMVSYYGSRNNTRCKKRHAFELSFGEFDTGKKIDPGMGNTKIGDSIDAVFMKHIPSTRMPGWAVRLWLDVVQVRGKLIKVEIANDRPAQWD